MLLCFPVLVAGNVQTSICQMIILIGNILAPSAGPDYLSSGRCSCLHCSSVLLLNNVFTFFLFNFEPLWTLLYSYTISFSPVSSMWYWESCTLIFNKPMFCMLCGMSAEMGGGVGRSCYKAHCEVPISCGYAGPWINKMSDSVRLLSMHFGRRAQTIAWKECWYKSHDMQTHKITGGCDIWLHWIYVWRRAWEPWSLLKIK